MRFGSFDHPSHTSMTSCDREALAEVLAEEVRVAAAGEHGVQRHPARHPVVGVVVVAVLEEDRGRDRRRRIGLGPHLAHPAHDRLADGGRVLQLAVVGRQDRTPARPMIGGRGLGFGQIASPRAPPATPRGRSSRGRRSSGPADAPRGPRPPTLASTPPAQISASSGCANTARTGPVGGSAGSSVTAASLRAIEDEPHERPHGHAGARPPDRDPSRPRRTPDRRCRDAPTACRRRTPPGTTPR